MNDAQIRRRLAPFLKPGLRNKLARAVWQATYSLLFRPSPRIAHGWRVRLLRSFGARLESRVKIYPDARIWAPWNLEMKEGSTLGDAVDCYNVAPVRLGVGSIVSQRSFLCTASHDFEDPGFQLVGGPIEIGDGAWVAAEAFVAPGVGVGAGAIVGARSVVTRDVPQRAVVAGNPAKVIGTRELHNIPVSPLR